MGWSSGVNVFDDVWDVVKKIFQKAKS